MNGALLTGLSLATALALVGFTVSYQDRAQDTKKDVRLEKGTVPGGVTLFGSEKVTPVPNGRKIATFGAG